MPETSRAANPAVWKAVAVVSLLAGIAIVFWGQMTRPAGGSSGLTAPIGGGLVGLAVWSVMRARFLARSGDQVPPTTGDAGRD